MSARELIAELSSKYNIATEVLPLHILFSYYHCHSIPSFPTTTATTFVIAIITMIT
jgi:hypothetical protein